MVQLSPAPATLGLASPAIGPWFHDPGASPPALTIPLPDGDLSCPLSLPALMEWWAPAGGLASWLIAGAEPLAGLRKADGEAAFATGALVVLFSLLPETAERLAALTAIVPRPEGGTLPPAPTPARPALAHLALEIAGNALDGPGKLALFGPDFPSDITTDADRAAYLGLALDGTALTNGLVPATILARPAKDDRVILKNRSGAPLPVKLRAFDRRGRPLDPGSVAVMLNWMAQGAQWETLFASTEADEQRTAAAAAGRIVHLVSAHEGPLPAAITSRLQPTGLTGRGGSTTVLELGANPSITLSAAADPRTDSAPLARLAPLPLGPYAALASATPFAGWTDTTTTFPLDRDFLRVAITDVEAHLTGQSRGGTDAPQADPRRRVTAQPNTAPTVFHPTTDAATTAALAVLRAGAGVLMAPELDADWGAQPPATIGGGVLSDLAEPAFSARAIEGAGTASGGTVTGQVVAVHFAATLPPGAWVRLWTHGLDTATGRRFRQSGAAGLADAAGNALLALPLPDGTAGAADGSVSLTLDLWLVTRDDQRLFPDLRFARPVLAAGSPLALPADGTLPAGVTLFVPELGTAMARGAGTLRAGQRLLALGGDLASGTVRLVDPASILPADRHADSLPNAAAAGDVLVTTLPAFGQTPEGSLPATGGAATRVHRSRTPAPLAIGTPGPSVERTELLAFAPGRGLVATTPGRALWHEAPPARLGHPGVSAAPEIHGEGVALAGPAADALRPLADERAAADLVDFVRRAGAPSTPATEPTGASVWSAVLETLPANMAGGAVLRAMAALAPSFQPGQSWTALKARIDQALGSLGLGTLDGLIDSSGFDDDRLATAIDRLLWKTRAGQAQFARAAQAAIDRAEDLIYLQTPAIDTRSAEAGAIDLVGRIVARMAARPGLCVVLCVPEGWLPDRTAKLEVIRRASVQAALKRLTTAGEARVALFSPIAGIGRKLHLSSSTVAVDDAILISGSAHLWRRGLTFDSALSVALFDDTLSDGRPAAVAQARVALMEQMLGLRPGLLPRGARDCVAALKALEAGGGFGRVAPGAYPAAADTTSDGDHAIWNPDGTPPADWASLLAALTGPARDEVTNAIR